MFYMVYKLIAKGNHVIINAIFLMFPYAVYFSLYGHVKPHVPQVELHYKFETLLLYTSSYTESFNTKWQLIPKYTKRLNFIS
jgi:hypothetical protein